MRTLWIFGVIVVFVTGMLTGSAFLFFREDPIPFWVIQTMAVATLLFSVFLYKTLIRPYKLLLSGLQLLKAQDFSTHLHPVKNKDANELISLFNKMITHLRSERLAVREKNQFLDLLIQASPQGILILDFDQRITDMNPSAARLLHIQDFSAVKGKKLGECDFELAASLSGLKAGEDITIRTAGASVYRCTRSSFVDQGFDHPFILIEELTHELLEVEKKSYERITRMMSHEVNNSIGAISSTLGVVSDIFTQEGKEEWEDVLPAVNASFDRCGHLAQFISNLAHVVRIPEPSFAEISLNEQARTVDALTRMECQRRNIHLVLNLSEKDARIQVDGIQFEQVLVNIIKNAYESIGEKGEIIISTSVSPLSLVIEDNGPGIPETEQSRLFTPFYTTKPSGQGIGLMFVRDVLVSHHCRFSLVTENGRTRFTILFPAKDRF